MLGAACTWPIGPPCTIRVPGERSGWALENGNLGSRTRYCFDKKTPPHVHELRTGWRARLVQSVRPQHHPCARKNNSPMVQSSSLATSSASSALTSLLPTIRQVRQLNRHLRKSQFRVLCERCTEGTHSLGVRCSYIPPRYMVRESQDGVRRNPVLQDRPYSIVPGNREWRARNAGVGRYSPLQTASKSTRYKSRKTWAGHCFWSNKSKPGSPLETYLWLKTLAMATCGST